MAPGEPDSRDASLCFSPEPRGQAEERGLRCRASLGCLQGWGSVGELEAMLGEMETPRPGGWPQSKAMTGLGIQGGQSDAMS